MTRVCAHAFLLAASLLSALPALAGGSDRSGDQAVAVSVRRKTAAPMFEQAKDNFEASFDPAALREAIEPMTKGSFKPLPKAQQTHLEDMRRDGNILRSLFISLDDRHAAPKSLDRFVTTYGKMNDALKAGAPDEAQKQALKLKDQLQPDKVDKLQEDLDGYQPTTRKSFDRFVAQTFNDLRVSLEEDQVPAPQFHKLRKDLRHLMNVLKVADQASPDPVLRETYDQLYALNDRLGLVHDQLVSDSLAGRIDYDTTPVKIPEELRVAARDLMDRFENR